MNTAAAAEREVVMVTEGRSLSAKRPSFGQLPERQRDGDSLIA